VKSRKGGWERERERNNKRNKEKEMRQICDNYE
jgi:hypothetical protein